MKGIDLSYHQGAVDWDQVKASGIEFIIPRDGWDVDSDGKWTDPMFLSYVHGAQEAGIEIPGIYHMLYAYDESTAIQNAACAINNCRKAGLPKSTIIWLDQEEHTVIKEKERGHNVTVDMQRKMAIAFCEYVKSQGYCTGIYLNKDYVNRVYGTDIVSIYDIWYEDHTDCQPDVKCLYRQINWQGRVNGIAADVDLDVYVGIHTAGTQTEGDNMSKKEKFIQALKKNGDGRYHYWDGSTMGIGCSEYTRICLVEAGVIKEGETFHAGSGNVGVLADTKRFMRLPWNPNTLQEADIQWSNYHHVNTWDGARGVYEAAPESTHGPKSWNVCDNGKTGVGHWSNHGYYNCGTGTNDWDCIYRIIEDGNQTVKTGKILSKAYVQGALALLDRRLAYENSYPYNCGLLDEKGVTWGDCWNINPKTTVWSMILGEPIWANQVKGEAHVRHIYSDGIKASGLPDCTGDVIMDKYCTGTTFRQMVSTPKAPCFLLINGQHMGAYLGEFVRDGKTYNVTEFSPNPNLNGKMRSYVDEYGQRWTCKGGTVIGAWNCCGYLTTYIDYSDWDDPQPAPQPTPVPDKTVDTLAQEIYAGKWGINPGRKASITAQYGAAMYDAAQKRVDQIVSGMNWFKIEVRLAEEILQGKWDVNPQRQSKITTQYGANAFRIAQGFVNSICAKEYTLNDLKVAYDVAGGIICGIYGNGEERIQKVRAKYGEKIRQIAQKFVNDIMK